MVREAVARAIAALAAVGLAPGAAAAQPSGACEARPALAFALDLTGTNARIDQTIVPLSSEGAARLTHAIGLWAAGDVPVNHRFAVRVEAARSRLPIQPAEGAPDLDAGDVIRSQLLAGLMVHPGGRRVCGHFGLGAGWQRLAYGDVRASGIEIGGGVGADIRLSDRLFVFLEAGLSGAHNRSAPPVNAEIFFSGRLLVGLRRTF